MELIDRVKKDIEDRLEELRPQIEDIPRLEAALAALEARTGAGSAARAARPRGRPPAQGGGTRRQARRRARRGQRREELLQLIRGNPEITIAEAARQMGVSQPQVSTVVRRLRDEGTLERSDGRFVVVEPSTFSDGGARSTSTNTKAENAGSEVAGPDAPQIEGPGVESLQADEAGGEGARGPEVARDEAGRPQAT